eukprot:TRINITY_DN2833_c0_g1_i2.p1 TRINITY_DN2833_c0_g1~~TRINITY_DN2833_c0_g1_i2.p1  ORF type:complete len:423 (-),score=66.94 TRINITY_DN2833_c0_g1_i2:252-1520(-)
MDNFKLPDEYAKLTCLIVVGMAGSGKTTFISQFNKQRNKSMEAPTPYNVNLDPAVAHLPYFANLDIRQTLNYKEIMKKHGLGPNGAILTALNLYCTRFDQVLSIIDQRKDDLETIVVDTPGQIEVFTWSASGSIISTTLSVTLPTVLIYVIDLGRCENPNSFMSNMLFCCSIMYKMKLPLVVVLNKCDVGDAEKVKVWMEDYEKYLEALEGDQRYLSCLSRSMCLVLDEFYKNLNAVAVSSVSGFGFDKLDEAIAKARKEYFDVFLPDLIANKSKNTSAEEIEKMNEEIKKFEEQLNKDKEIKESTPPATGSAPSLIVDSSRAQRFEMQFDEENKNIPSKKSDISKKSEEKLKKDGEGGDVKQVEKMMDELEIKSTKNDAIQSISRILWMGLFWIEETLFLQRHPKTHLSQYCFFIGFLQDT